MAGRQGFLTLKLNSRIFGFRLGRGCLDGAELPAKFACNSHAELTLGQEDLNPAQTPSPFSSLIRLVGIVHSHLIDQTTKAQRNYETCSSSPKRNPGSAVTTITHFGVKCAHILQLAAWSYKCVPSGVSLSQTCRHLKGHRECSLWLSPYGIWSL